MKLRTRRKASVEQVGMVVKADTEQTSSPCDENLLERTLNQWQFGDWESLAKINRDTLHHHPDRAKLALLAAAGRLQTGKDDEAKACIRLAQDWGISNKLISQILIAGVHNSLGRAAALGNHQQRALQHFESAITLGISGSAKELIANARARHELSALGLLPDSQGRLQQYQARAYLAKQSDQPCKNEKQVLRPVSEAHAFYINLGQAQQDKPIPFLLIDSKSLPRSGLHYLKNTLNKVFGEYFSFCEWYQETGCCKQMPCALTGFASHAQETCQPRIRLVKSHDFDLSDPIYPTYTNLRRLVLVRDPLYILTSWFALAQLESHKAILIQNGININKIWLAHEKEVLNPAYRLLNEHFFPPTPAQLADWLESNSRYIKGFIEKWVRPAIEQPRSHISVLRYEDLNQYICALANEYVTYVSGAEAEIINKAVSLAVHQFKKREDPFFTFSENLSDYLNSNKLLFTESAEKINECMPISSR